MYCRQCGGKVSGDARYCPNCGTRQEMKAICAEEPVLDELSGGERRKKAQKQGRRLGNFLVSLIALWILFMGKKDVSDVPEHILYGTDPSFFTVQDQREMTICNEDGAVCTIDIPQKMLYSKDRSCLAYIDRDRELYYLEDNEPVFIDDEVDDAKLSFHGTMVIYVRSGEAGGKEFCGYDTRMRSLERETVSSCRTFAVASDGKTAACVDTDRNNTLFLWRFGRQMTEIAGNVSEILAVSDNGKTVFYQKSDGGLFCYQDDRERKVADTKGGICFVINESQSEMVYSEGGSTWYYAAGRKEPLRLAGVKGNVRMDCYMANMEYQREQGLILGRRSLKNMIFATDDSGNSSGRVYYLDWKEKRAKPVFNHADQFQISKDGLSILGLSDQKLYYVKDRREAEKKICLSGDMNVSQFAADGALEKVWFVTSDRGLYYIGEKEYVRLSYALDKMYGCCKEGVLFQEGRNLYLADGEEKIFVKEEADDVRILENGRAFIDADGKLCSLKDLDLEGGKTSYTENSRE